MKVVIGRLDKNLALLPTHVSDGHEQDDYWDTNGFFGDAPLVEGKQNILKPSYKTDIDLVGSQPHFRE